MLRLVVVLVSGLAIVELESVHWVLVKVNVVNSVNLAVVSVWENTERRIEGLGSNHKNGNPEPETQNSTLQMGKIVQKNQKTSIAPLPRRLASLAFQWANL